MQRLDVINQIIAWGADRNLIEGTTPINQFHKLIQESGEWSDAYLKGKLDEAAMELGDVFVVAIIIAAQMGKQPEDLMQMAYDKIKHRKGKMINNVFVKEEDL
ncbi:MazG-like family protein [bacterium]|nr:MazG-like family protein [bacterium]